MSGYYKKNRVPVETWLQDFANRPSSYWAQSNTSARISFVQESKTSEVVIIMLYIKIAFL